MLANRFVQPLFEGPVDIVADVHGEIDALLSGEGDEFFCHRS